MVTGAFVILWLATRNGKYGIGGQSAIIFVNIIEGINATLKGQDVQELLIPLLISIHCL